MHADERMTDDQVAETLVSLAMARAGTALHSAGSQERPRSVGNEHQSDDDRQPESPFVRPKRADGRAD